MNNIFSSSCKKLILRFSGNVLSVTRFVEKLSGTALESGDTTVETI